MTGPHAHATVLVIDDAADRHGDYPVLLGDLACRIAIVRSIDDAKPLSDAQGCMVLIVRLDGSAAGDGRGPAMVARVFEAFPHCAPIFVSGIPSDIAGIGIPPDRAFDYLPAPIPAPLLRAKVRSLLELCLLRNRVLDLSAETRRLAHDVDEKAHAVDLLRALVSEQAHRGKNLLAIIQSVTMRTVSDGRDAAEARSVLVGRIHALARAYDLLTASKTDGASLCDIIEAQLRGVGERVTMDGPVVRLSGTFVQTFALAMHELATNALKFGALREPSGSVRVGWTISEGLDRYLEIGWTERGGAPPVKPTSPKYGFGLSLISSMAGPGAEMPNFSFGDEGFACRMRLHRDMVIAG